ASNRFAMAAAPMCSSGVPPTSQCGTPSAFYRPGSKPLNDSPLKAQDQDRDRHGGEQRRRQDLAPGYLVLPPEERDGHRHGLPIGPNRKGEREEKLIPAVDKDQDS